MLKILLNLLVPYFPFLQEYDSLTLRAAYATVMALVLSLLLGKPVIKRLKKFKIGQSIRQDGPATHLIKEGTPTMGGVLMILVLVLTLLLWVDFTNRYTALIFFSSLSFAAIGFIDDYLKITRRNSDGLNSLQKIIGQFIIALIVSIWIYDLDHNGKIYIPFFSKPIMDLGWFYIPFAMILLIGSTNAVNLTDGLDGLASGLSIFVGGAFAIIAYVVGREDFSAYLKLDYIFGSSELTIYALAIMGSSIGFLWFNSHPATVFMGDTGSLFLGGSFGTLALILKKEILFAFLGGIFVLEALSVIIQVLYYKSTKKRFFKMAPIHHHFELKGWKETKVVTRFWIIGGILAVLALSTLRIQF